MTVAATKAQGFPMASLDISTTTPPIRRRRSVRWGFFGSTFWILLATAAMFLAQFVAVVAVLWFADAREPAAQSRLLHDHGGTISAATIAACPAVLAVLWLAIRLKRRRFAAYLALRWPSRSDLWIGLAVSLGFFAGWDALSLVTGQALSPDFVLDITRTARDAGLQRLLVVALCVAAPMTEEFAVRGFLFRGYSSSYLGTIGAILLSSVMWTALHVQYDGYFMTEVLLIGLLLGYLRYRSRSTWLTVILHAQLNLFAWVQAVWIVART
jgi:uncharacterized protein